MGVASKWRLKPCRLSGAMRYDARKLEGVLKLIIQIQCLNEEGTLGLTLSELPRSLPGVESVEWLVVDDGSEDATSQVAKRAGVDHIIRLPRNQGLARAYMVGLDRAIQLGADIIVNTDADNQYSAKDIPKLIQPILAGEADIVIGTRPINSIPHFDFVKKTLQKLGSWVVRMASQTTVEDAPSGFRAISRKAAMQLHVFNNYTYTLETIIQAGQKNMAIVSVPIQVNKDLRPSRLVKSIGIYVRRSMFTIIRVAIIYRPLRVFASAGAIVFMGGFALALRYLYFIAIGEGVGHVQSIILSALLMGCGGGLALVGILADLIAVNRKLLEDVSYRLYRMETTLRPNESSK